MLASSTASAACVVPGTDASTRDRACSSGILLKSAGRLGEANVHGPPKSGAENQRPDVRKYTGPLRFARNRSLSVLLTHSRPAVPAIGEYAGSPFSRISSAGVVVADTRGASGGAAVFARNAPFV